MNRSRAVASVTTAGIGFIVCLLFLTGQSFAQGKFNANPRTAGEAIDSLVWANRILSVEGIFDYAGHVSVRNPENPKTFFIARSAAPETVTKADILEVDMEGNVVTKTAMTPYAERIIHARILNARPEMNAVIHSHPIPLIAFSVSDVPLKPVTHSAGLIDSTGVPVYDEYDFKSPGNTGMLVTTKEEGDRIARKLGKGRAVLMRGHGFAAAGTNIPDLIMTSIGLRNNALVQLATLQLGGKVKYISSEESGSNRVSVGKAPAMERAWNAYVERVPALGVLIFEVILNATSLFNHGNVRLPASLDRVLRFLLVTPDMHRVHHSVIIRETNSNFGFNLPWWDRLFGTYRDQPAAGHLEMTIGLSQFRDPKELTLPLLLLLPFVGKTGKYPMGP